LEKAIITKDPLAVPTMEDPNMGSFIVFQGKVRNHSENGEVQAIEYSAYEELALSQLRKIVQETEEKYSVTVYAAHRIGKLIVGETALVVATLRPTDKRASWQPWRSSTV